MSGKRAGMWTHPDKKDRERADACVRHPVRRCEGCNRVYRTAYSLAMEPVRYCGIKCEKGKGKGTVMAEWKGICLAVTVRRDCRIGDKAGGNHICTREDGHGIGPHVCECGFEWQWKNMQEIIKEVRHGSVHTQA